MQFSPGFSGLFMYTDQQKSEQNHLETMHKETPETPGKARKKKRAGNRLAINKNIEKSKPGK